MARREQDGFVVDGVGDSGAAAAVFGCGSNGGDGSGNSESALFQLLLCAGWLLREEGHLRLGLELLVIAV